MSAEAADQTLQPTALVHEVYLRLNAADHSVQWDSPGHFYCAAAEAMRRILIEAARRRNSLKRGGNQQRIDGPIENHPGLQIPEQLLSLNESLDRLNAEDPVKAMLVKLRYFAGMSHQEAAKLLGISRATADRYWAYSKTWLFSDMNSKKSQTNVGID